MKKFLLFLFLVAVTHALVAQRAYYDAVAIRKYVNDRDGQALIGVTSANAVELGKIFRNYGLESGSLSEKDIRAELVTLLRGNPFLDVDPNVQEANLGKDAKNLVKQGLAAAGGMDVTALADGFARFLAKRTKEELNVAFFSRFSELLNKPEYADAQQLFPQTYLTLKAIGEEIYNYEAYLNSLREAFAMDLNGLLPNLERIITSDRHKKFFEDPKNKYLKEVCLMALYLGKQLQKKVHPGKILADFPTSLLADTSLVNVRGSVETLKLLSESLRSKNPARYWVPADSLEIFARDTTNLKIYLGLFYLKAKGVTFKKGESLITLQKVMADAYAAGKRSKVYLESVRSWMTGFEEKSESVISSIDALKEKEKDKREFADYYQLFTASMDLFEYATTLYTVDGFEKLKPSEKLLAKIELARAGGMIALDLNSRNYASAMMNAYQLYNQFLPDAPGTANQFILKYGSFMATVAQAQNSEEVAAAIEAVALPSGSSRIKRVSAFNVALNGYVGFFAGREIMKGAEDPNDSYVNSYGITAPVGISISHGIHFRDCPKFLNGTSLSLFLSVIDLGAVTAFRLSNDSTESVPTIQLKDIISPGAFISIGFPRTPLSLNFGWQMGPALREVKTKSNEYEGKYSRVSLSLCVDIPVINFYTQSRSGRVRK